MSRSMGVFFPGEKIVSAELLVGAWAEKTPRDAHIHTFEQGHRTREDLFLAHNWEKQI